MTSELERLRSNLQEYAAAMERIYANFPGKYSSTQKLIAELGIGFDRKIESSFIGEPRECHKNAFDVLMEYPKPELYYCEGFATYAEATMPVYHAWLVSEQGTIIDPTWRKPASFIEPAYIGVVFDREFVRTVAVETGIYGLLENDRFRDFQIKRLGLAPEDLCPHFHPS
ncbi:hypothetical protein [Chamaesiphon sp. OTE_8_metabat_110]|uniref:hypothetical protein n=1 Tax=Chamaesiphon sp. OTE_8_metabat_110 TaxID=2964696 RepID=UPI00286D237E|nr:hypothetical protein [Chamaesiphon sp. OTE_8_metabat_110]